MAGRPATPPLSSEEAYRTLSWGAEPLPRLVMQRTTSGHGDSLLVDRRKSERQPDGRSGCVRDWTRDILMLGPLLKFLSSTGPRGPTTPSRPQDPSPVKERLYTLLLQDHHACVQMVVNCFLRALGLESTFWKASAQHGAGEQLPSIEEG